jgi:5-methylcytosine-specific restriction endonuclease McrA
MSVKHLCNYAGCRVAIPLNERYCTKHSKDAPKRSYASSKQRSEYEAREQAFYHSKQWKNLSKQWRLSHVLCAQCEREGRITEGRLVDHIQPIRTAYGWQHRLDESNLQTLCFQCHSDKTTREVYGRGGRVQHPTKIRGAHVNAGKR